MFHSAFNYFVAIMVLLANSAMAQNENWDTWMATFSGKPGSVLVDLELHNVAPDTRYPYLVVTGPVANDCPANGIPTNKEVMLMEDILGSTTNFLTGVTARVLAGTFTHNCRRLNYYYVKDTALVRNAVMRMYRRNHSDYNYVINMKHEPDWKTYNTFLYPDAETQNRMENTRIITSMLQAGDSLKIARNVTFAACFSTDTARAFFIKTIEKGRYKVQKTNSLKTGVNAQCVTFSMYQSIVPEAMDKQTAELRKIVQEASGTYYGWEAPIANK